jgi:cytochrome oxidase Cu insertion factor (SCO1/SenC/PrrC family)
LQDLLEIIRPSKLFLFPEENMKTQHLMLGFVLLLAIFLVACNPQTTSIDAKADEQDKAPVTASEMIEGVDDDMMSDKNGDVISEDKGDMATDAGANHNGDNIDSEIKDDDMISDEDGGIADHSESNMMDAENDNTMADKSDDTSEDSMKSEQDVQLPDWFKASLVDVNSDKTFTLADFKGKVILVETLAMWCSNCLKQQGQVQIVHDLVGERDDFVSIGLDIDPNENADALKAYTSNNGFDWIYAVAPGEVSREIAQRYGDQFLNPPSTPMLIIDRQGDVHPLPFGIKYAEDLLDTLQPFLDTGV